MEMALNILDGLTGDKSRKRQRESNVKVLSPRFAPVMRDKIDAADAQLSPTIFALYDDNNDDGDNMLSPNKDLNRSSKKQQGDTALSIAPVPKVGLVCGYYYWLFADFYCFCYKIFSKNLDFLNIFFAVRNFSGLLKFLAYVTKKKRI